MKNTKDLKTLYSPIFFMRKNVFNSIFKEIEETKVLDKDLENELKALFPDKFEKAVETMEKGIIQYTFTPSKRILWTAIGEEREHIIYPRLYCDCLDFYKNVVINKKNTICKHLLALELAQILKRFKKINLKDEEFKKIYKNNILKI